MRISGFTLTLICSLALQAADGWTEYKARPGSGSKVTIEGTSTIHDWTVESLIVGGSVEVGPNFPLEGAAKPGPVQAKADCTIPVRSLKSVKDGKPYNTSMDDIMYGKLLMDQHPRITFALSKLTLKEAAPSADAELVFDAEGDLEVAGVKKAITMPVQMSKVDDKKLKFSGAVTVKMSDFNIEPPAPKIALGAIKTGEEVKLSFDWVVARR